MDKKERIIRKMVRRELKEMLSSEDGKEMLNENFMGMVGLQPIGGLMRRGGGREENWSYNADAVREMNANGKAKSEPEVVRETIDLVNEETEDSVSVWIEENNLVAEISTEKGLQTIKLSEAQTKKVLQTMIEEMSL